MPRTKAAKTTVTKTTYLDKVEAEVESNQSRISLILGALIVIVAAFLAFNYFNKGTASQTSNTPEITQDASKIESNTSTAPAPTPSPVAATAGQIYTVKEGDTLFLISQQVYNNGDKYPEIAKANKIQNPNLIEAGQKLEIPKLDTNTADQAVSPAAASTTPVQPTAFGPKITTATYVVVEGDWLSKISERAYGDIQSYKKIAEVNKISNPDLITPGMTLIIPR